jgi:hypothetical protein
MSGKRSVDLPEADSFQGLLRRIALRIRQNGPFWLFRRTIREIQSPVTGAGRSVNMLLRKFSHARRRLIVARSAVSADMLLAFYDLQAEPNTFDVMWFLLAAEQRRQALKLRGIHVVFVGYEAGQEREEPPGYLEIVSQSSLRDRITNILVPHAWALPATCNVEVLHDRREAKARLANWEPCNVFPEDYSSDFRHSHIIEWSRALLQSPVPAGVSGAFRASEAALAYVDRWLKSRQATGRAVSITIRHYEYNPTRNSNLDAWKRFAQYLTEQGYFPLFVPDTESLATGLPEALESFPHFSEGAVNLNLRIALYERCFLNLGINNGPAFLFLVDERAAGIMFKIVTPGVPANEPAYLMSQGFEIGGQIPFCTPYQKRVWEEDEFDVIKREFHMMESRLRAHDAGKAQELGA